MATFTGSITKLSCPACQVGANPVLQVGFNISARSISMFEDYWHAFLLALDVRNNQISEMHVEWFGPPTIPFVPWPDPDNRTVAVQLPLTVPLPEEGLDVAVQLYGGTSELMYQTFLSQKELFIKVGGGGDGGTGEKTNYAPFLIGAGTFFLLALLGGERR